MRVYPHPDTKALSYTDDGGHTTTFNLAELMGELEHVGKEIEKYKPKKQNVFVPVFVFVVSTKPKSSGDEVIREFITVRLDLDYEHRLLSKNPGDGVLADTDNLDAIAQADIIRGYETFSTRAAGEKAAKDALKGVSSTNINHSERIFLQVMRKPENHEKLVQLSITLGFVRKFDIKMYTFQYDLCNSLSGRKVRLIVNKGHMVYRECRLFQCGNTMCVSTELTPVSSR